MKSKHRLNLVVLCLISAAAAESFSQDVKQSDLALCASQESAELKLACFEALATISTAAATEPAEDSTEKGGESQPPQTDAHTVQEKADSAGPEALAAGLPAAAVAGTPEDAANADQQPATADDDFGSEHLDRDTDDMQPEVVKATVVSVTEGRYKVLFFTFSNGQRWRQIEGRRFRYPKNSEFDVIITRGMMGDYRMRLDENSPMTRVRRIE